MHGVTQIIVAPSGLFRGSVSRAGPPAGFSPLSPPGVPESGVARRHGATAGFPGGPGTGRQFKETYRRRD